MTRWTTGQSLQILIRPDSAVKRSYRRCFQRSFFSFLAFEAFQAYYYGTSCRSAHVVRHEVAILLFMFCHFWVLIVHLSTVFCPAGVAGAEKSLLAGCDSLHWSIPTRCPGCCRMCFSMHEIRFNLAANRLPNTTTWRIVVRG